MSVVVSRRVRPLAARRWIAGLAAFAAVAASTASAQSPAPTPPPASPALPAPPEFAICATCHETAAGGRPSIGPSLWNIGGRKAGSTDYDYSPAMKASTIVWTADTLQAFATDPAKTVPGNKMDYEGAAPDDAKVIADYLMKLKG